VHLDYNNAVATLFYSVVPGSESGRKQDNVTNVEGVMGFGDHIYQSRILSNAVFMLENPVRLQRRCSSKKLAQLVIFRTSDIAPGYPNFLRRELRRMMRVSELAQVLLKFGISPFRRGRGFGLVDLRFEA